jgi:hypothetical protein
LAARGTSSAKGPDSGDDDVSIPHLNLGQVGNDCYDLPQNLYIDASVLDDVDPSVFENKSWVEAENLTNCEEWREKTIDSLYDRARLESVCKAIKFSLSGSSQRNENVTGLFLVGKAINPVDTVVTTADPEYTPFEPDDKLSREWIIGIAGGAGAISVCVLVGIVAYCRSKDRKEDMEMSSEYSPEEESSDRHKASTASIPRDSTGNQPAVPRPGLSGAIGSGANEGVTHTLSTTGDTNGWAPATRPGTPGNVPMFSIPKTPIYIKKTP